MRATLYKFLMACWLVASADIEHTKWQHQDCCFAVPGGATEARLAVLFAGGAFGVWELDSRLDLRQVRCTVAYAAAVRSDLMLANSAAAQCVRTEERHYIELCKTLNC